MRHPLYILYGLLMIGTLGYTAYNGGSLGLSGVNEVRNVPKSVRDNPGAYRSIYGGYNRYTGGK